MSSIREIIEERTAEIGTNEGKPGSTAMCLQSVEELVWLAPFIQDLEPSVVVEIGIYKAGWQHVLSPWFEKYATIIGIDSMDRHKQDDGDLELEYELDCLRIDGFNVKMFQTRSDDFDTIEAVYEYNKKIDLLHIDGEHSYDGAHYDWKTYGKMVRSGGLVVFHDVGTQTSQMNVKQLWEEIKAEYPGRTHEHIEEAGIGVVEM